MKKRFLFNIIIVVAGYMGLLGTFGCSGPNSVVERLNLAEELMEERADSAFEILNRINGEELQGNRIKARYALLMSMAMDKNYIDTTNFDVLQPAIDYYLNHGNTDEKLRTYYYQGVIYGNAGKDDLAMQSYLSGLDNQIEISDSLTLSRMLVAQSMLFYRQYEIKSFVSNNLRAASIYALLNRQAEQLKCNLRALTGEVILNNKLIAESILLECNTIINGLPSLKKEALMPFLKYAVNYGKDEDVRYLIEEVRREDMEEIMSMTLARAYSRIGDLEKGLQYLDESKIASDDILDSLAFWSIKTEILEKMGEDRSSLDAFRNYSRLLETYHATLFNNELLFSEKKHEMEIDNMAKIQNRDNIIKWISIGTAILVVLIGSIFYRYRINKAGRLIAEQNAEKLQLETEKLQLEAENLQLEVGRLEEEHERLNGLLERSDGLSAETMKIIRERLNMLNGLLAKEITNDESHAKEFRKYVDIIKKDRRKFQKSLRRDLEATHPHFFADLEKRGLTDREIDYVCLYAIGLRGKEVGGFLDVAGHYNISSEIRRKLGLDSNGENLGPFIRKMMGENKNA